MITDQKKLGKVLTRKVTLKQHRRCEIETGVLIVNQWLNRGQPFAKLRKEKGRLTAFKKYSHTLLRIWKRGIYFASGTFKITEGSCKTESLLSVRQS